VRKAALILGIVFAVFAASSLFLRMSDIPGYGLLGILAAGCFSLFALPVQMIYNLQRNKNGLRRAADVTGLFGLAFLLCGLVFRLQRWPGATMLLLSGIAFTTLFGILFIAASRQEGVHTQWFPGFTATVLITLFALSIANVYSTKENMEMSSQFSAYESSRSTYEANKGRCYESLLEIDTTGSIPDSVKLLAHHLYDSTLLLIGEIEMIKNELIVRSNDNAGSAQSKDRIEYPDDIDTPTWYLVGEDVVHPQGAGMDVYELLKDYRYELLPESVAFTVPVSSNIDEQQQWTKDNFYHATVMEALTRLTNVQIAIQNALKAALETHAYTESE
jgi:hypothetical protein